MNEEQINELIDKRLADFADEVIDAIGKTIDIATITSEKALHAAEKAERAIMNGDVKTSSNTQGVPKSISKDIGELKTAIEELKGIYKIL